MTDDSTLLAHRLAEVRRFCEAAIVHDHGVVNPPTLSNRAWLAQSIINIVDGKIDGQLSSPARAESERIDPMKRYIAYQERWLSMTREYRQANPLKTYAEWKNA